MTKKDTERRLYLFKTLNRLGFSDEEINALRRAEMTLRRWYEHECNGDIQREGEDGDGAPYWWTDDGTGEPRKLCRVPDRERGARRRVDEILKGKRGLRVYHQTDPRGCALYIVPLKSMQHYGATEKDLGSYYSSCGIPVCY